jgi:hypothetical protein
LGSGTFGCVWKAFDTELNRAVAIKQIKPGYKEKASARLHARALARLDHPNIVKIHQIDTIRFEGEPEGSEVVVMEWLNGKSVYEFCQGEVGIEDVIRILRLVAKAIEYMHENDATHYDLHAGNIIVGADFVKIIDVCVFDADANAGYSTTTTEMRRLNDLQSVRTVLSFCAHKCKDRIPNLDEVLEKLVSVRKASELPDIIDQLENKSKSSDTPILHDLTVDGLNKNDIQVLQCYGELLNEAEDNTDTVSNRELIERLGSMGMQLDKILSSMRLLEELGFIKLPNGETADIAFLTLFGFDKYLQAFDPKRNIKMDSVIRAIIQDGATTNNDVTKLTKIPVVMVNHLLHVLEVKKQIEIRKYYGQTRINHVTKQLINKFANEV